MFAVVVVDDGIYGFIIDRNNDIMVARHQIEAFKQFEVQNLNINSMFWNSHFKPSIVEVTEENFRDYIAEPTKASMSHNFFGTCRYVHLDPEKGKALYDGGYKVDSK